MLGVVYASFAEFPINNGPLLMVSESLFKRMGYIDVGDG